MIVVFQFFRAAAALVTHPGDLFSTESESLVRRREEMNEVVQFAMRHLRDNSPVGGKGDPHAGLYRDSHMLFVNGNDVEDLRTWQPSDEIEISNSVPYARILEVGDKKMRVPHHTYELAAQALRAKYGDMVSIGFDYLPIRFGKKSWTRTRSGRALARKLRRGNRGLNSDVLIRQPTLSIRSIG